jgi:formylglycine-generating enzyme required for sulfatase activity
MVWCNAATEWYNDQTGTSFTCVYTYLDQIIRDGTVNNLTACNNAVAEPTATGFRFPTSNEWELAARWRGSDSTNTVSGYTDPYFTTGNSASHAHTVWSDRNDTNPANGVVDNKDANDLVAVYNDYYNSSASWEPTGVTGSAAVKSKLPNTLGLYDMSGNVSEYCFEDSGANQIERGGSWAEMGYTLAVGQGGTSSVGNDYEGFRLARNY